MFMHVDFYLIYTDFQNPPSPGSLAVVIVGINLCNNSWLQLWKYGSFLPWT